MAFAGQPPRISVEPLASQNRLKLRPLGPGARPYSEGRIPRKVGRTLLETLQRSIRIPESQRRKKAVSPLEVCAHGKSPAVEKEQKKHLDGPSVAFFRKTYYLALVGARLKA